jgi:sugar lactone lactonase YvrE
VTGELYYGSKLHDVLRAFGMVPVVAGRPFYVSDESEEKTYKAEVGDDGTISTLKLFAEQGGESAAADAEGNVYIAAGHIFVYDPAGHRMDTIEVPERPLQLLFGGKDGHALFILTHRSLYSIETRTKGQ